MTLVLPHEAAFARELRREMSGDLVFFSQHYFRTDEGETFAFKDFHVEMMRMMADEKVERMILLEPASFGKTTTIKHYLIWLCCMDPNVQVVLCSKNAQDAEMRLGAVKAEMEANDALISDFGPFVGDLWRDDSINVAHRTVRTKDPSIVAIGSTSSIYGKRATHFVGDDIVTEANSGPQVEPKTRERLSRDYKAGVQKVGFVGRPLYIRLVNTVVDQRDLIHELGDINQHDRWDTRWTSSKRYHVVRRPALDERSMTSLWPEKRSVESLLEEKAEDLMAFLRRMQNLCMDPLTMPFQRVWFDGDPSNPEVPGCLDYHRCINEEPRIEGAAMTRTAGFDPNPGTSENSKFSAYGEVAFDRRTVEPRTYYVTDLVRFRAQIEDQAKFCADRAAGRGLALLNIEDNAANQWLLQVNTLKAAALSYRIQGHNTNVKNKYDPEVGIPAMAGRLRAGRIRFPYHCAMCRERTETIIGEFLSYPQGATTDMIMALWMGILAADQFVRTTTNRVYDPANSIATSPWVSNRGITPAAIETWMPSRTVVN